MGTTQKKNSQSPCNHTSGQVTMRTIFLTQKKYNNNKNLVMVHHLLCETKLACDVTKILVHVIVELSLSADLNTISRNLGYHMQKEKVKVI